MYTSDYKLTPVCKFFPELSDWSLSDDDENIIEPNQPLQTETKEVFLPGCNTPLQPPVPVSTLPGKYIDSGTNNAEKWLSENVLPPYWILETDGRNKFPLKISSTNPSANLMKRLETLQQDRGMPADLTIKVNFSSYYAYIDTI